MGLFRSANIIVFLFVLLCFNTRAENEITKNKKIKTTFLNDTSRWIVEIPVWIPGFRGEYSYGEVELEGEDGVVPIPEQPIENPKLWDSFRRLFNSDGHLNYVFIYAVKFETKRFFVASDGFSGSVGNDVMFRYNNSKLVNAKFQTTMFRAVAGYNLYSTPVFNEKGIYNFYGYGGIRFHYIKVFSSLNNIGDGVKIDPLWAEPIFGINNELLLKRWRFVLRADMGDFKLDSKLSYMVNIHSYYKISNILSFKLGWNIWHIKHFDTYLNDDLRLKIHMAGPSAAIAFNF